MDGVPGPVRTANLPLRRGMLYPIELLGRILLSAQKASLAMIGEHVNGQGWFCHVVRSLFDCRRILLGIANCKPTSRHHISVVQIALPSKRHTCKLQAQESEFKAN